MVFIEADLILMESSLLYNLLTWCYGHQQGSRQGEHQYSNLQGSAEKNITWFLPITPTHLF